MPYPGNKMITLLFTSQKTFASVFIRLFTWSSWSHVAFICKDGTVIEAVGFGGVRRATFNQVTHTSYRYAIVEMKLGDPVEFEKALVTQIGKKYDFIAALGIGLNRKWRNPAKWVCSELIAWGFEQINKPLFREEEVVKVSQEDLWRIKPEGKTTIVKSSTS